MSDANDPLAWVKRAEEDYLLAKSALRHKNPLTYGACFHAQQCAEKYIKAILVSRDAEFPKVHDLLLLSDLCEKIGVILPIEARQLNTLADYGVRVRYPGEEPDSQEARDALQIARAVRRFVRKFLGAK